GSDRRVVDRRNADELLRQCTHCQLPPCEVTRSATPTALIVAPTDGLITSSTGAGVNSRPSTSTTSGVNTASSRTPRSDIPIRCATDSRRGSATVPGPADAPTTALPRTRPCTVRWYSHST